MRVNSLKKLFFCSILLACVLCIVGIISPSEKAYATTIQVNDEASLRAAGTNASVDTVKITVPELTLTTYMVVNHDLRIVAQSGSVTLKVAAGGGFPHMRVQAPGGVVNITIEFSGVDLVGNHTGPSDTAVSGGILINSSDPTAASSAVDTLTLINARISYCNAQNIYRGGAISSIWPSGEVKILDRNLVIDGADTLITNNDAQRGGAIFANHVTIKDGTISHNTATQYGGAIFAYGGFEMTGGLITENTAATYGGGIAGYYFPAVNTISGGVVSNNTAGQDGGGLYATYYDRSGATNLSPEITISGNAQITNNTAATGGGVHSGTVVMDGGLVAENSASGNGGGIFASYNFSMSDGLISGNEASGNGGGIIIDPWNKDLNLSDIASYTFAAKCLITGGNIEENTADGNGGGIYAGNVHYSQADIPGLIGDIDFTTAVAASDCTVSDNVSGINGGGIYNEFDTVSLQRSTLTGNSAAQDGGAIWIGSLPFLETNNVTFANNTASQGFYWTLDPSSSDATVRDDSLTHIANILDTVYTSPFTNSYNNYEVNYLNGTPLDEMLTVIFESNGGSLVGSQLVVPGGKVQEPANPTKDGFVFAGWYSDPGLTMRWDFAADTVTQNITLYAKWDSFPTYSVVYDSNGGSGSVIDPNSPYFEGDMVSVLDKGNMVKDQYVFLGWSLSDTATVPDYLEGDTFSMPAKDVTLYAVWSAENPPSPDEDSTEKAHLTPNTGDNSFLLFGSFLVLLVMSVSGLVFAVKRR